MSTGDDGPRYYPQSGPAGGYRPYQPPQPAAPRPAAQEPAETHPAVPQPDEQYAYSPYPPAAFDPPPAAPRRPGAVAGAFVLLVLSALPFLVGGVLGLFVPITQDLFPPELGLPALLTQYNVSFDQFAQAIRLLIGAMAVLALLYIAFAFGAFAGRSWARVAVTILTVLFTGFLLINAVGTGTLAVLFLVPAVLAVAGVVLLFRRRSTEWFAGRR